jgi:integrase
MRGHVRQRGKRWAIILDVKDEHGGRRRKWYSGFRTRKEAEIRCAALIAAMERGTYVEPTKLTVRQLLQDRLEQWTRSGRIGPKAAERYRQLIDGQIDPHIGGKPVQRLRVADIEVWHNVLRKSGLKNGTGGIALSTIRAAHRVLAAALRDAVRHGLVPSNIASLQGPPKADAKEVRIIAEHQLASLLDKIKNRPIYSKVVVALFTGLRRSELLGLQWQHVELDGKLLHVRQALEQTHAGIRIKGPKTQAGRRTIALPDIVVDALREHRREQLELRMKLGLGRLADDAFVFANLDGSPQSPAGLTMEWYRVARKLDIADITWHSFRHTHASMLIASGLDVVQIARRLGHSSPNVTLGVYAHMFKNTDSRAADIINAALARLGPKR